MVSPVVGPSPGLETLLAKPPTPLRERHSNSLGADSRPLNRHPRASRLTLHTPPSHSPDSALSTNASSRRSRKKVEFTAQAEYCESSPHLGRHNEQLQSTPLSAASSIGLLKPLKSILKRTSSPIANSLDPSAGRGEPGDPIDMAELLESSSRQLAGVDHDSRLDAYTALMRGLKTSTNVPDRILLQSKMSLFLQFMQRDIAARGSDKAIDVPMVKAALILLCTCLHFPAIASAVTSEFGVFIIDHCIRSFEDCTMPKEIVRHLMQVLVCQNFSPKVMTADRVGRLVLSLHHIEDYIKGKSIILSRIIIYRRLIRQSPLHMVCHTEWLLDLFTDMLSSISGIRTAAIGLGLEASFTVAKEPQLPKKVMEILQMSADETRYVEFYIQRLTAMTKEKSEMHSVPQIWSIVVLLLRCPIERWEFFDQWLAILQRCFNSSDAQTKIEAYYAWNRLVYSIHLHETSFSKTIGTLCQPFNQLRRMGKQSDELRKVIIGGLCNLYYYAFKPKSSSSHVDHYWDASVKTLIRLLAFPEVDEKATAKSQVSAINNLSEAANILSGLFDSSNGRLWRENRVSEGPVVQPDELPPLDPKWIRRNTTRVFSVVEPILQNSFLDLAFAGSSSSKLWRSLVGAIAAAAAKEVKVSADTAGFLGSALGLLMRIWASGLGEAPASPAKQLSFLEATEAYLAIMVHSIGHLPFTEKTLSMNKNNTFIPTTTPSRRSGKDHGPTRSSLHHLFSILSRLPPGLSDSQEMSNLFKAVFGPFLLTRSPRAKRVLAQELMQIPTSDRPVSYGSWVFVAEALSTPVDFSQSSTSSADSISPPIGLEYRDMVKHLERGITSTPNLPWAEWSTVFNIITNQVTDISGEIGCSIAVIEPLAKAVLESCHGEAELTSSNLYKCCAQLISRARQPRDRQTLDIARKRLWGTTAAGARSASFDPFDDLYKLASRLLVVCYRFADKIDEDAITSLLTEISHFLSRSNQVLVFKSLVLLQEGIGPWIQDADERYGKKLRSTVAETVNLLWDRICYLFSDTTLENFQLDAIEQLLCCAFQSKHRYIVNNVVLLWNKGFENASEIQYPETLKNVLLSLRSYIDISLPGLESSGYNASASGPMLVDSQDDIDPTVSSRRPGPDLGSGLICPSTPGNVETPKSSRIALSDLSKSGGPRSRSRSTRSARRSKTPKMRHDDSQIKFAAIEDSSPLNPAIESQVLTNRQKEVRERQLENAALFPSIRSSPQKGRELSIPGSGSQRFDVIPSSVVDRSATPKARRNYDYVSSTPTPRRGPTSMLDEDQEMTDDIPSSPPEPRRNLLPEMKSHSRDIHMLDDMPVSSSPVIGSPMMKLASRATGELVQQDHTASATGEPMSSQQTGFDTHVNYTNMSFGLSAEVDQQHDQDGHVTGLMIQQPTSAVSSHVLKAPAEPKSDSDVYLDALTSPVPEGPSAGVDLKDRSFDMSYDEERSMARLVIELDSRKCGPLHDNAKASHESAHEEEVTAERLTAYSGSQKSQKHAGEGKSRESLPPIASPSVANSLVASPSTDTDMPRSSAKRSQKKRRRGPDSKRSTPGKRRKQEVQADEKCIANSQASSIDREGITLPIRTESEKAKNTTEHEEPGDERLRVYSLGSPDLTCDPSYTSYMESLDLDEDSDVAAVNLQLISEAAKQSDAEEDYGDFSDPESLKSPVLTQGVNGEEKGNNKNSKTQTAGAPENNIAELSAVDRITASLRNALAELRTAKVSRDEVYQIEDIFMDIKAELYGAEKRGRG